MTGETNKEIWERLGEHGGRLSAVESSQRRIEERLESIDQGVRSLTTKQARGTGFWTAVSMAAGLAGATVGFGVWAMAEAEVPPFDADVAQEKISDD